MLPLSFTSFMNCLRVYVCDRDRFVLVNTNNIFFHNARSSSVCTNSATNIPTAIKQAR